ncbi:hypothetical protein ZIOFF_052449 [Zingiber officinale]|uniref:Protein kinase domain-containing protein n=1 Tax=Zingiber officinale TaxID=94328 RepID=A0A8J5KU32_ZINOF|nr:hypothetical protein ZIOFF_052449 [Zingiber officinale]
MAPCKTATTPLDSPSTNAPILGETNGTHGDIREFACRSIGTDLSLDPLPVSALNVMFRSLNSPSQLNGWKSSGGDPCGDDWKGITCSGSSVTRIYHLPFYTQSRTLGSWFVRYTGLPTVEHDFGNLFYSDMSKNNLNGDVPYQLPPNADHIDLGGNTFSGGIPFSISQMSDLTYLNLAHNQLHGQLTDTFGSLHRLSLLDLSYNQFSGNLPQSCGSLSDLKNLLLQNNQFSGSIGVLAHLSLEELNIQNNQFTGWIPNKLKSIHNLKIDGNSWSSSPAPSGMSKAGDISSSTADDGNQNSGMKAAAIVVTVIAVLVLALLLMALVKRRSSASSHYIVDQYSQNRSSTPLVDNGTHKHSVDASSGIRGNIDWHKLSLEDDKGNVSSVVEAAVMESRQGTGKAHRMVCSSRMMSMTDSSAAPSSMLRGAAYDSNDNGCSYVNLLAELKGSSSSSIDLKSTEEASLGLAPAPTDAHKSVSDNEFANKFHSRRSTDRPPLTIYSSSDLQAATRFFNSSSLLGEGSIGRVYKATVSDGKLITFQEELILLYDADEILAMSCLIEKEIKSRWKLGIIGSGLPKVVLAVKKIETLNLAGTYDFMEIVSDISKLHHPNMSELLGYCSESGCKCLVYEYQWNGSLHGFLHLSDEYSKPLTWDTRVRIALGTARAVEYLHEVCSPSVIHKNIKSANILLDAELNPRLSDSGLSVFFEDTSENLGPGYNAPECTKPSAYTLKSDVYSFGVVMLELLTGRKPFDSSKPRIEQSLVRWAAPQLHDIDALAGMVDPALRGLYPPKSLSRFADVIALCIQSEPAFRPAMSEVVQVLVRCIQRTSINKRMGGDLTNSHSTRSEDSDGYY